MEKELIWSYLIHLGYNMWEDTGQEHRIAEGEKIKYPPRTYLRCQKSVWDKLLKEMAKVGINMVLIDLGEGVKYESHPELAIKNSWSVEKLKKELKKIREMGIEPIPKLNFSTAHDNWLGKYSRCVSTDIYYGVCKDLIKEVIDIFDKPRFFHLGMDEENYENQRNLLYVVIRQYELWWNDLYFLVNEVEKNNVKAWIWSDYIWRNRDEFLKKMPKTVIQSNWYYGKDFSENIEYVKAYIELDKNGYSQIPTGSNHAYKENFQLTVDFCKKHISNFLGFLQTAWRPTVIDWYNHHLEAIKEVGKSIKNF